MKPFVGRMLAGDKVVSDSVEGCYVRTGTGTDGEYEVQIEAPRKEVAALAKANRLETAGGRVLLLAHVLTSSTSRAGMVTMFFAGRRKSS